MSFVAKARGLPLSPYKMRPLIDVIRGKNVQYALAWLATYPAKRAMPISKMVASAAANAKSLRNIEAVDLFIKEIRVDQGPMTRYYKPGAMGRSGIYRKRFCHMEVVLEQTTEKVV